MSITDSGSVLVLGAGVSAPFGLHLGGDLIGKLKDSLQKEVAKLHKKSELGDKQSQLREELERIFKYGPIPEGFKCYPVIASLMKSYTTKSASANWNEISQKIQSQDIKKIEQLIDLLDGQTSETIDDFIVENPSYAYLTKLGIAASFFESCHELHKGVLKARPFAGRDYPPNQSASTRNWIHHLINIVRQGIRAGSVTKDNKVCIITFNYDKILEYVLEKQFSNTQSNYEHYSNYIDIIHMHGECGDIVDTDAPADKCIEWANGIHVVNEPIVPAHVQKQRLLAREIVQSASQLYFCGFSFAGPNCRLLGLESPRKGLQRRTISFCNYDGNIGISKKVKQYEIQETPTMSESDLLVATQIEEVAGTVEKPLGVADWVRLGYLGELSG